MLIYNDLSIFEAGGKPSTVVTAGGTRRAYSSRHERNGQKKHSPFIFVQELFKNKGMYWKLECIGSCPKMKECIGNHFKNEGMYWKLFQNEGMY